MKFERTVFFLTVLICIGVIAAAYYYRQAMIMPTVSVAGSEAVAAPSSGDVVAVPDSLQKNSGGTDIESSTTSSAVSVTENTAAVDTDSESEMKPETDTTSSNGSTPSEDSESLITTSEQNNFATSADGEEASDAVAIDPIPLDGDAQQQMMVFDELFMDNWQDWS